MSEINIAFDDTIYTDFPDKCLNWECQKSREDHSLVPNFYGFMSCPVCGGSYGETEIEFKMRKNERKKDAMPGM